MPSDCNISINVNIHCPMPKSWSTEQRNESIGKHSPLKPDVDNILKFYFDVLNEVAYVDDCQIVEIRSQKRFAEEGYVEIEVMELEEKFQQQTFDFVQKVG